MKLLLICRQTFNFWQKFENNNDGDLPTLIFYHIFSDCYMNYFVCVVSILGMWVKYQGQSITQNYALHSRNWISYLLPHSSKVEKTVSHSTEIDTWTDCHAQVIAYCSHLRSWINVANKIIKHDFILRQNIPQIDVSSTIEHLAWNI